MEWIVGEHKFMQCEPYDTRRTRLREYPIWQPSLFFPPSWWFFYWLLATLMRTAAACSEWIVGEHKFMQCEPYDTRRTRLREYPIWQPSLFFPPSWWFFYWLLATLMRTAAACSEWIVGEHKFMQREPYDTRRTRLRE